MAETAAPSLVERQSSSFATRMGAKGIIIIAPSGQCPLPLTSTEENDVIAWCEAVFDKGLSDNRIFTPAALAYFARYYFDIQSNDYKQVRQIIYKWGEIDTSERENVTYEPRRTQSYESYAPRLKPPEKPQPVQPLADNGLEGIGKATIQFEE